jgi:hypothetical protein
MNGYGWLGLVLVLAGCASSAGNTRRVARRATPMQTATSREDHSRCDQNLPGRTATEYDTNGDGVPDVRKVYQVLGDTQERHSVLICREADLNHDGTKDIYRFYTEEGRTLREEEDRNFDGRVDVITFYENGEVVKREEDSNGDGQVDVRVYFRDHRPFRAEREIQHDNSPDFHPDYWEFYNSQGHVVRIGWDYDHDGRADRWDRVDRVAPMRTATPTPAAPAAGTPAAPSPAAPSSAAPSPAAPAPSPANGPAAPATGA